MTDGQDDRDRGELARALLALRRARDMPQIPFAEALGVSQAQVSRIELGRRVIGPELAGRWCDLCDASVAERAEVMRLVEALDDTRDMRVVFQRSGAGANYFQERVREHERGATLVRAFQPGMVLGQLQTTAYAGAVFGAAPGVSAGDVADLVAERRRRWARIEDEDRQWWLIQTEGALGWCLGGPDVMEQQIEHIIAVSCRSNVRVGIVPTGTPAGFVAHHGFHLYDEAAVQVGTKTATGLLTDPGDVGAYVTLFGRLEDIAVYDDEARTVLQRIAAGYRAAQAE